MNQQPKRHAKNREARPNGLRKLLVFVFLTIVALLAAYFKNRPTSQTDVDANLATNDKARLIPNPTHVDAHARPVVQITKPLDVRAADVEKQAWPTEILNDRINDQLHDLATLFSDVDRLRADSLMPFAADDVVAINLQPKLTRCFSERGLQVDRVAQDKSIVAQNSSGIVALIADFKSMLRPFDSETHPNAKFKVVTIEAAAETVSTTLRVHLSGESNDRRWQQNAVWNCEWSIRDERPKLTRVENKLDEFERIVCQNTDRIFSDQTEMMLGKNECFDSQLRQDVNYWLSRLESAHGIDLLAAHGISIADVNGDGLDDVYVCQPGGLPNRLFISTSSGDAIERAADFGLDICDTTRNALFVDLENDGDQDVALVVADQVLIFENAVDGKFLLRKKFTIRINPSSILAADFDSDGLLDLYVLNHDTADSSETQHGILGTPIPFHDANNGGANVLLRNVGNFEFQDVTSDVGLDQNNLRFSLAGCWEDFDDDGDMDIYVANDFGRNNLYRNEDGKFVDAAHDLGVEDLSAGMSVSWGDVDNDGQQDLYVSNMFSSAGNRIAYQRNFHASESPQTRSGFQRHARGNSLFLQTNEHRFKDMSRAWNVTMGRWAWASKFADINNDGWLDILVTNGFVTNEDTHDL